MSGTPGFNRQRWPTQPVNPIGAEGYSLVPIDSYAVLEITGIDAGRFLHGQCTADVDALGMGDTVAGAICTVKGRVLTSCTVTRSQSSDAADEKLYLKMPRTLVNKTLEYLQKYAAFFKVELTAWRHPCVLSGQAEQLKDATIAIRYRIGETEFRESLVPKTGLEQVLTLFNDQVLGIGPESRWRDQVLRAGWVTLTEHTSEKYLPHQLNLDVLGAISFTKGCYTGQEIIARTEYRGKPKRRVRLIEFENLEGGTVSLPAELTESGTETGGGTAVGDLINLSNSDSQTTCGLALLPLDLPSHGSLTLGDQTSAYQLLD